MAVCRPMNSEESNLYHIRCVVNFSLYNYSFPGSGSGGINIAGGTATEGSSLETFTNLMESPTTYNLPENFGIYFKYDTTDSANNKYNFYMNYGRAFASAPHVSITPLVELVSDTGTAESRINDDANAFGIVIPQVDINSNSNYTTDGNGSSYQVLTDTGVASHAYNVNFKFYKIFKDTTVKLEEADHTDYYGFCVDIIGPSLYGMSTGNSHRGWGIGAGNSPSNLYSYMNVGIGTSNSDSALTVRGSLDAPYKYFPRGTSISNIGTSDLTTNAATLVATRGNVLGMYDEFLSVASDIGADVTLTARKAEDVANDIMTLFNFEPKSGLSFDLTITNLMSGNTVELTAPSNVTDSPTSTHTEVGSMVIAASSTGTFRFHLSTITFSVYSGVFVYQIIRIA